LNPLPNLTSSNLGATHRVRVGMTAEEINQAVTTPRCRLRLRSAAGRERLAVMKTTQIHSENGAMQGVVAPITDVTEEADAQMKKFHLK